MMVNGGIFRFVGTFFFSTAHNYIALLRGISINLQNDREFSGGLIYVVRYKQSCISDDAHGNC